MKREDEEVNPAAAGTANGVRGANFLSGQPIDTTGAHSVKPSLKILVRGEALTVPGRDVQMLLIERGPWGLTSVEASPMGWGRRASAAVQRLRALGVDIVTVRDPTPDGAWIARYSLGAPVVVIADGCPGYEGASQAA